MNANEEEIQKSLERGEMPNGDELDVRAYRQIFRDFAARIITRVKLRQQKRDSRDYFWFVAGLVFLAVASLTTILFSGLRFDLGFLKAMSDYKGLAVFGVAVVAFLNWLDKRLVRGRQAQL